MYTRQVLHSRLIQILLLLSIFIQFLIQVFLHCLFGPSAVEPVFLHFILLKSKYWVGIELLNWVQRTSVVSIIERHALSEI